MDSFSRLTAMMSGFSAAIDSKYSFNFFDEPREIRTRYARVIFNHNNHEEELGRVVFIREKSDFIGVPIYICTYADGDKEQIVFTDMALEEVEPNYKKVFKNVSYRRIKKFFKQSNLKTGYIDIKNNKKILYSYIEKEK